MQNLKFLSFICQTACHKTRFHYGSGLVFSHTCQIYKTVVLKKVYPQRHDASFYPLLVSFCLQIAYEKVRNLRIGVDKLIGKVSINLLHLTKFIMSRKVSCFYNHHDYCLGSVVRVVHLNKLINKCFIAALSCKLAPAQYKCSYYLVPPFKKQIKTKL